jgi:hypothetical protein
MQRDTPPLAHKLISNQILCDLVCGDPMRSMGEISERDQASLCMALPKSTSLHWLVSDRGSAAPGRGDKPTTHKKSAAPHNSATRSNQ